MAGKRDAFFQIQGRGHVNAAAEALLCLRLRRITRNKIFRYLSTLYRFLGWMNKVLSKSEPPEDGAAGQRLGV
jgi:hypothetical protein